MSLKPLSPELPTYMTTEEAIQRLATIKQEIQGGDYECAHGSEDAFHKDVLKAIAQGAPNAAELAQIALLTTDIEYPRYYA